MGKKGKMATLHEVKRSFQLLYYLEINKSRFRVKESFYVGFSLMQGL